MKLNEIKKYDYINPIFIFFVIIKVIVFGWRKIVSEPLERLGLCVEGSNPPRSNSIEDNEYY